MSSPEPHQAELDRLGAVVREAELAIGVGRPWDLFTEKDRERCRRIGEAVARQTLCTVLDALGADGVTAFLNKGHPLDLHHAIFSVMHLGAEKAEAAGIDKGRKIERDDVIAWLAEHSADGLRTAIEYGDHIRVPGEETP